MKLSVVVPVYNAEATIAALTKEVFRALAAFDVELILVNDGSKDSSPQIAQELARQDQRIVAATLRKNFGEHNAVMCGLHFVTGDVVAIIDDDLQNPPTEIIKLVAELEKGFDVVFAQYTQKRHHPLRNLGSAFHNRVASYLLEKPRDLYLASFKVMRREVAEQIILYKGPFPYIDGLALRVTQNLSTCVVEHRDREAGSSNYNLRRLVRLYLAMLLNFSILPLRAFTIFGFLLSGVALLLVLATLVEWVLTSTMPQGYTSLFTALLFFSGVQIMFIGLIGEYLGRLFFSVNGTPQWVVKSVIRKGAIVRKMTVESQPE
ncbi:MAG: glycosyltransferase family 2 protein [Deltaproteobacteria bacterium]|nr:glycosyltransferase family 2 protein [Deltaproteobacteria bacterium]